MSDAEAAYDAAVEEIRAAEAKEASTLSLMFPRLTQLPPEIGGYWGLRELSLSNTQISDLAPLQTLGNLRTLWLNKTGAADLSPLQSMAKLRALYLDNAQVSDVAPLQALADLRTLWLSNTQVSDVAPLQALANLGTLRLDDTQVSDIAPLQALAKLRVLNLGRTQVSDIAPLQALTNLRSLHLDNTQVADLVPLQTLAVLRSLYLDNTQVTDLAPLQALANLQLLHLDNTQVADLAPLQALAYLQSLWLNESQVADLAPLGALKKLDDLRVARTPLLSDLRPLCEMQSLVDGARWPPNFGLYYRGCLACELDPEGLGKLSEIESNVERTEKTLTYLRNLVDWPPASAALPEQDDLLLIAPNDEGKLDVVPVRPGPEEAGELLKRRLYQRLRGAFAELAHATGNQQPDVCNRARAAADGMPEDFAGADIVEIYLEVAWARSVFDRRGEREGEDRLGNVAVAALDEILTVGPGIVLDNPEVEKLEERRRRFDADPLSPPAAAAQQAIAEAIAGDPAAFGDTLRAHARWTAGAAPDGADRRGVVQRILARNVVIAAGKWVAGAAATGIVGSVAWEALHPAAAWLLQNQAGIQVAALGWGEMFLAWLGPVFDQARVVVAAAQSAGAMRPAPRRGPGRG